MRRILSIIVGGPVAELVLVLADPIWGGGGGGGMRISEKRIWPFSRRILKNSF